MMKPKTIKTIQDLIKWNLETTVNVGKNESRFLFRGVSNENYQLIPKIYRDANQKIFEPINDVSKRINRLKAYLKTHLSDYGYNLHAYQSIDREWHEVFLAQHYGAPTNLLDFTRNPLVSAFFACKGSSKDNAKIYAIKIQEQDWSLLNKTIDNTNFNIATYDLLKKNTSPYDLEEPKFIVPPMIDKRIQTQIGVFCCFQISITKPLNQYPDFKDKKITERGFIQEFEIKGIDKSKILDELNKIGINDKALFPDMNGFGNFITWKLLNMK